MNKYDLIKDCRYYKGEEECPFETFPLDWFWDCERVYVNTDGALGGEASYYKNIDGKQYSGIPYNLVTVMFTSWGKSAYDIRRSMANFYDLMEEYLDIPSDHYAKDKLPSMGIID